MLIKNLKSAAILVVYGLAGLCLVSSTPLGKSEQLQNKFSFLGNVTTESEKGLVATTYYLSTFSVNWTEAAYVCMESLGTPVSVETEEENTFLNEFVGSEGPGLKVWTSGMYVIEDADWRWTGSPEVPFITFQNWCDQRPVSPHGRLRIRLNFSPVQNRTSPCWESPDDTNLERFICEIMTVP